MEVIQPPLWRSTQRVNNTAITAPLYFSRAFYNYAVLVDWRTFSLSGEKYCVGKIL